LVAWRKEISAPMPSSNDLTKSDAGTAKKAKKKKKNKS
jgi:hypothetical protein